MCDYAKIIVNIDLHLHLCLRHSSHHIEETDAGLDMPLYLRKKLYDKTLKSENLGYYSNILRFPASWRSALWLYNTSWLDQNLSKRFLKAVNSISRNYML